VLGPQPSACALKQIEIYASAELLPPVPEPATMSLLALGGLALLRRRRAA